jgi:bifunctional non-homologous end joining protein LigD
MSVILINKRRIATSNTDKIWFDRSKITKGEILDYYAAIAPYALIHVKNHLLTLQRFPEGIKGESFYQKNASAYFPAWIKTCAVPKEDGTDVNYVIATGPEIIVYLANQGTLTFHMWLSQYKKLPYPDRMIFDLDPSIKNFNEVRLAALFLKEILDDLAIASFAMTTGSRGLHVMVPLKRVHTFDEIAQFSTAIARKMLEYKPGKYTLEIRKNKRGSKIFIDTLRNRISATAVMPYSVRPIENAPVATPLWWREVEQSSLSSQQYTIKNIMRRIQTHGDAWQDVYQQAISLKKLYKTVGM